MRLFLEMRNIVDSRVNELEKIELKQQCKIKLNGNNSFRARHERDLRSILRMKELNIKFQKQMGKL